MAKRSRVFLALLPLSAIPTRPSTGKRSAAYSGGLPLKLKFSPAAAVLPFDVVIVMLTTVAGWLVAGGLKVQAVPTGSPLQPKVTMPSEGSSSSTLKANCAAEPALTVIALFCGVITIGGPRLILSVAVLLLGFTSPPPETVAVLVKLF